MLDLESGTDDLRLSLPFAARVARRVLRVSRPAGRPVAHHTFQLRSSNCAVFPAAARCLVPRVHANPPTPLVLHGVTRSTTTAFKKEQANSPSSPSTQTQSLPNPTEMYKPPSTRFLATTSFLLLPLTLLLFLPQIPLPTFHPLLAASPTPLNAFLTLGIKTYICDNATQTLLQPLLTSIRTHYPTLPILVANDGTLPISTHPLIANDPHIFEIPLPHDVGISAGRNALVNATTTPYFLLLDDDHLLTSQTDLPLALDVLRKDRLDLLGFRILNNHAIHERRTLNITIPRYVANVSQYSDRTLTLCVWNENNGPDVSHMTHALRVDVLHNAFIARTQVLRTQKWREQLKVNEHMTFFLDARRRGLNVGYLPRVSVRHRARSPSQCYMKVRDRETQFASKLEYHDEFRWDAACGKSFPERVRKLLQRDGAHGMTDKS